MTLTVGYHSTAEYALQYHACQLAVDTLVWLCYIPPAVFNENSWYIEMCYLKIKILCTMYKDVMNDGDCMCVLGVLANSPFCKLFYPGISFSTVEYCFSFDKRVNRIQL